MPDAAKIRETLSTYVERWNASDKDGWLSLFVEDATQEDPVGGPVNTGHEAIGRFWDLMKGMGDSRLEIAAGPIVCGAEAAMPIRITADVGGTSLALDAVDVMSFAEDGRIASMRAFVELPGA
jgi:steroid Delta-isomerase